MSTSTIYQIIFLIVSAVSTHSLCCIADFDKPLEATTCLVCLKISLHFKSIAVTCLEHCKTDLRSYYWVFWMWSWLFCVLSATALNRNIRNYPSVAPLFDFFVFAYSDGGCCGPLLFGANSVGQEFHEGSMVYQVGPSAKR